MISLSNAQAESNPLHPIKVLLIEDNPGDARLIQEMLMPLQAIRSTSTTFDLDWANELTKGLQKLAVNDIDIVLLDLLLPDSQGLDTFLAVHTQVPEVPIVVLTALDDEALAIEAMRQGAQDYLLKDQIDGNLLLRALRYAIERKRTQEALRKHRENLEALVKERTYELAAANAQLRQEIAERQRVEQTLREHEKTMQRHNRELMLLYHASQTLISILDLDQVLITVLEEVRHMLDVVAASIWLIDTETDEIVCRQATGPKNDLVRGWRLPIGEGLVGWTILHSKSLIVEDAKADPRHFKGVDQETGLPLRSILSIPLRVKKGIIGVIQVLDTEPNRFDYADLTLMESLAATAAMAIENARLYEQARQDAETKATLLQEVNHRVKNNLTALVGLLYAEQRYAKSKEQQAYQTILMELTNRIQGLVTVHAMLSDSGWSPLPLDRLSYGIIQAALQVLPRDKQISVTVTPSPVQVSPKQANSLALVINELATNSGKYAFRGRKSAHINVRIRCEPKAKSPASHNTNGMQPVQQTEITQTNEADYKGPPEQKGPAGRSSITAQRSVQNREEIIILEFRDDGPGYPEPVLKLEEHNVGLYLVQAIIRDNLEGTLELHNDEGAVTTLRFKKP